jgi:hypothetical protein
MILQNVPGKNSKNDSGLFHLDIPGRGEHHLFQTPPPIEENKNSTHHHQKEKKIIEIISCIETPNLNEIKSLTLMIYQYMACKSLP